MSLTERHPRLKKATNLLFLLVPLAVLLSLFLAKDTLITLTSSAVKQSGDSTAFIEIERSLAAQYDYTANGQGFSYTFLEFGSTGCSSCMKMEQVMADITAEYGESVQAVFYNTRFPEHRTLLLYFGIAVIPTQIVLDRDGVEIYRHTGFISKTDLLQKMGL